MRGATARKKKEIRDTKIRLEREQHELISLAASAFGLDLASYVRRAALKEARADLVELQKSSVFNSNEHVTRLSEVETTSFLNYIEGSPKPNAKLTALKTKYFGK